MRIFQQQVVWKLVDAKVLLDERLDRHLSQGVEVVFGDGNFNFFTNHVSAGLDGQVVSRVLTVFLIAPDSDFRVDGKISLVYLKFLFEREISRERVEQKLLLNFSKLVRYRFFSFTDAAPDP